MIAHGSAALPERDGHGDRVAAALAQRRAKGVRLGRPRRCPDAVLARVVALRRTGVTLTDIAEALNTDGVLTPGGGHRWYPGHVWRLLRTQDAQQLLRRDTDDDSVRSSPDR